MTTHLCSLIAVLFSLVSLNHLSASTVPEPSTILYGKVFHRTNGHEHLLTEGTLTWTLRDQNGQQFTFTTELEDIRGTFSYRLAIPHQALATGLAVDPHIVPLRAGESRYDFLSVTIDGFPVEVASSSGDFIKLLQRSRAATHRIDLRAGFTLADTDTDGMPDWWEKLHGLDWQKPDGHLDRSGDGWTNLQAYLNGADPNRDNRVPTLLTKEVSTFASSPNGIWLRAIDTNTAPSGLVYSLLALPAGGTLQFDAGQGTLTPLQIGSTFTQRDVESGRVRFLQNHPQITSTTLSVSLTDGTSPASQHEVAVEVFSPDANPEPSQQAPSWWRNENSVFEAYWSMRENVLNGQFIESSLLYFLGSNHGWTIWDQRSQTLPVTLTANGSGSHFILGGDSPDILIGSSQDDIISGGRGQNRLRGGGGRDLFIIAHPGTEILEDFSLSSDVLDLGTLLKGKTGQLSQYLSAQPIAGGSEIRMNLSGAGSNFTDSIIRLEGVTLAQDDLHRLWANGQLLLGAITGSSSVSIEGWPTQALEEGFTNATLTLRRRGPLLQPLTVSLAITGSASNGVDVSQIPTSITFPSGSSTATVSIEPLTDGLTEGTEILQIAITSGQGYVTGTTASGQISIIDALQRFSIVAEDQVAVARAQPGYFAIRRAAANSSQIQIRLTITGATSGVEFSAISTLVTFGPNETHRYIEVQALPGGDLAKAESSKLLTIAIQPSSTNAYLIGNPTSASMRLLSEEQTFESWASQNLANVVSTNSTTSATVSPRTGLDAFLEYAFSYSLNLQDGVNAQEQEALQPRLGRDAGGWHFEFSKRLNDPRLEYIVERSSDLVNWHSDPALFTPMTLPTAERNRGRIRLRVVESPSSELPFMRVRVVSRP